MGPVYLTLTSTAPEATNLGYLLHKHPDRAQQLEVSAGVAHVFYPEADEDRCTVALLLEVDPIDLVRRRRHGGDAFALGQYVNDRPYAASSMLAVALGKVFRTAMAGRCDARPELVDVPLPLEIRVPVLPSVGGPDLVGELFEPLGWTVQVEPVVLDETLPSWGDSRYVDLRMSARVTLAQALTHLYVLLPVLDSAKHYWVSEQEVDKLVRTAGAWLPEHPARELIMRRYLANQRDLVATAVSRLTEIDALPDQAEPRSEPTPRPLAAQRATAVLDVLRAEGAARVVDLGCGEGALLAELLRHGEFTEVVGVDVSARALLRAERRLGLDRMSERQRARLRLLQSSLTYHDERLTGYDALVLMEVVEHLDPERLPALESTVFARARPAIVVVTTPNVEHNVLLTGLAAGEMRHPDHRFEWSRAELADWASAVAARTGYTVRFLPVGLDDPVVGPPTQMAVFRRRDENRCDENRTDAA